jgi:CheY-like chemotaxis protein/HPt (histidine-containing phosphotransfer) domain-containing protein
MKPVKQSELYDAIRTALGAEQRTESSACVPCFRGPSAGAEDSSQGLGRESMPPPRRLRILLAEDNAVNQILVVRLLEKEGHRVTVAGNGREVLDRVAKERFDLVLMDVQMPEISGFEATASIRRREGGTGVRLPIVAMTAHAMKGDRERCLEAGMDGYVAKPIQAAELFQVIERTLPAGLKGLIDWDRALKNAGGDRDILRDLVAVFLGACPEWLAKLREAVDRQDAAGLRRLGHTVKGAMGLLGADSALAAAERVEALGRDGNLAGAGEACAALELELRDVQTALGRTA